MRPSTALVTAAFFVTFSAAAPAKAPRGAPIPLSGTAGCVNSIGGGCATGSGVEALISAAASSDGANLYSIAAGTTDSVASFSRNGSTGVLTQLGDPNDCIAETGAGGACVTGKALGNPTSVEVAPDGKNVYVTSDQSNGVAVFTRTAGVLTQLAGNAGCASEAGQDVAVGSFPFPVVCNSAGDMTSPRDVVVSPDNKHVYVTTQGDSLGSVVGFSRAADGTLTQLPGTAGCVSTVHAESRRQRRCRDDHGV